MDFKYVLSHFKVRGLALAVLLTTFSTTAVAATPCWQAEENPVTKAPYESAQDWDHDLEYWSQRRPGKGNPLYLVRAYSTYRFEQKAAMSFKNDKQIHCFYGCRISQRTNFQTAQYVAWLKEDRDIKDCNLKTHFEIADFEATIKGAEFGTSTKSREECAQVCSQQF
ncbi:hypothetical protein [Bdellovibrio sp. HCB337]|uniref:hypothetical protein n=1 Tax=Bdellovibrio sp. HCB337 TaxID=3394358 RepID=UPI0039A70709